MSEQEFYVDEFFLDPEDAGTEELITIKGRQVPFTLKRGLSIADEMAAQAKALRIEPDPENPGKNRAVLDSSRLAEEIAVSMIAKWPYKDRATGEPLPITVENFRRMLGGANELSVKIRARREAQDAALVPSDAPSAED